MKAKVRGILRLIVLCLPMCLLIYCIMCGVTTLRQEQPETDYGIIKSLPKTELKSRNPGSITVIIESTSETTSEEVSDNTSEVEESIEDVEASQEVFEESVELEDKDDAKHPMGVESKPPVPEYEDTTINFKPHPDFVYYDSYYDVRYDTTYKIALSEEHQSFAYTKCKEYGVPFEVMMGLWGAEASWNIYIGETVSSVGDHYYGIGQIRIDYSEDYLKQFGVDLCTPLGGLEGSIIIIRDKLSRHGGDVNKALMAYNFGDYGAEKQWDKGVHSTSYTKLILSIANNLKEG